MILKLVEVYYSLLTAGQIFIMAENGITCRYVGSGKGEHNDIDWESIIRENIKEKFGEDAAKETVFLTSINDKNSIFKLADYIKEKVGG